MALLIIIGDDCLLTKALSLVLSDAGYDVTTASNGADGLALLRAEPADLVITDVEMPQGGLTNIQTLRAEFPCLPIIAMSGRHDVLPAAAHLGAQLTLAKPFTIEQILDAVGVVLRQTAIAK